MRNCKLFDSMAIELGQNGEKEVIFSLYAVAGMEVLSGFLCERNR